MADEGDVAFHDACFNELSIGIEHVARRPQRVASCVGAC